MKKKIVLCHSHSSIKTFEFLTYHFLPSARNLDFKVLYSELGEWKDYSGKYFDKINKLLVCDHSNKSICPPMDKYILVSTTAKKYVMHELYPKLSELNYTVASINFTEHYTAKQILNDRSIHDTRDRKMFETSFRKDTWDEKSLILVGIAHCNSWHKQGWINQEIKEHVSFVKMIDLNNENFCKKEIYNQKDLIETEKKNCLKYYEEKSHDECHDLVMDGIFKGCLDYVNSDFDHVQCNWQELEETSQCLTKLLEENVFE